MVSETSEPTIDPFELVRRSHPRLANVTKENLWQHMAHVATWLRHREILREDSLLEDPYADALSRECGAAMVKFFPEFAEGRESGNYVVLRAFLMEQALRQHDRAIRQVVILGAGMDTRAFRLPELADCTVFEIQVNEDVMSYKEQVLRDLGADAELQAKRRTVLHARLDDDSWQQSLLAAGFDPRKPVFWLMESTFHFLSPDAMMRLLSAIDFLSMPHSQLVTERIIGGGMDLELSEDKQVTLLIHTELRYGQDGGVFREFPWQVELLARRSPAGEYFGTMWEPERFDRLRVTGEEAFAGPFFIPLFTKPE